MGEFFKGWRRKAGLVMLAMACLLSLAWLRSYEKNDRIDGLIAARLVHGYFVSTNGDMNFVACSTSVPIGTCARTACVIAGASFRPVVGPRVHALNAATASTITSATHPALRRQPLKNSPTLHARFEK